MAESPAETEFSCTVRVPAPPGAPEGVQFLTSADLELAVGKDAYWGPEFTELTTSFLDTNNRAVIDEIMAQLNVWPGRLKFVWTQGTGIVRITTGAGGFWSMLGRGALQVPASEPTMNLQWAYLMGSASERRRVIPHEGGHARGYWHEHLRDQFVRDIDPAKAYPYYARTQGWGRAMVDANVLRPVSEATIMATPPDGLSIMCYPIVPEITYSGRGYTGGSDLTESDRAFDLQIYPWPVAPPPPPPPTDPPPVEPDPPVDPELFGPYELLLGDESDKFTAIPGTSVLFRLQVPRKGQYAAATRGKADLKMDLMDARKRVLKSDDDSGAGGNPLIAATLAKGTYYLRVSGSDPEARGVFTVKWVRV